MGEFWPVADVLTYLAGSWRVERTVRDLATKVLALTGSASRIEYRDLPVDDPHVRCPDITRAKSLLNWRPEVGTDQGLRLTIDYFRRVTS